MSATTTNSSPILTIVNSTESEVNNRRSIERNISIILKQLGIRTKFVGFKYLKTAISLCYENPDEYAYLVTKRLYPAVAKIYRVNTAAIERSIRSVISNIACSDMIKDQIIGYTSDSYTNKEFINSVAEYIRYL